MNDALIPVALIAGSAVVLSVFVWQIFATGRRDAAHTRTEPTTVLLGRVAEQQRETAAALAALTTRIEQVSADGPPPTSSPT